MTGVANSLDITQLQFQSSTNLRNNKNRDRKNEGESGLPCRRQQRPARRVNQTLAQRIHSTFLLSSPVLASAGSRQSIAERAQRQGGEYKFSYS